MKIVSYSNIPYVLVCPETFLSPADPFPWAAGDLHPAVFLPS